MVDQASVTVDKPRAKLVQWLGSLLFLGGIGAILIENYKPEWLPYIGGPSDQILPFAVGAILCGVIVNFIGLSMAGTPGLQSGLQASMTTRTGGKERSAWQYSAPPETVSQPVSPGPAANPAPPSAEEFAEDEDAEIVDDFEGEDEEFVADVLERSEWASGRITSNTRSSLLPLWLMAAMMNVISVPIFIFVTGFIREGHWGGALFYLFPLFALLMLFLAVRTTIQYRKFGDSTLILDGKSGIIGGSLKGTIRCEAPVDAQGDYNVRLRCSERITTGTKKNRRTETKTRWEATHQITRSAYNLRAGVPVCIDIPDGPPESFDEHSRGVISWTLAVSVPTRGVDYEVEFEVPVLRKRKGYASSAASR